MNAPIRAMLIAALTILALAAGRIVAQEDGSIIVFRSEMALTLSCQGDMAGRRRSLLAFLKAHGFDALDLSGINDHSGRTFSQNAALEGIDPQERIVSLATHDPPETDTVDLVLIAPPAPAQGTARLRDQLEHFGRRNLQCKPLSVRYGHNDAAAANAYEAHAHELRRAIHRARQ